MNWNLDFADSETLDRLVDSTGDARSQDQHSSFWNERLNFPPSSCYLQQGTLWTTPRYPPVSPATSEESSCDQAPLLHTGHNVGLEGGDPVRIPSYPPYNDLFSLFQYLRGSRPRSPLFGVSVVDPPDFLPRADSVSYYPYDSRPLLVPSPLPASSATPERIICSECPEFYEPYIFKRRYELDRHIKEQHRCTHQDCVQLKFPNKKEKLEHERIHNEGGLGFFCGTCSLSGLPSKSLVRMEKLMKHSQIAHHTPKDLKFLQCTLEPCYFGRGCGGIYFSSGHDLNEHFMMQHPLHSSRGVSPDDTNYRPIVSKTPIENVSVGNVGKRSHGPDPEPEIKRLKQKRDNSDSAPLLEEFAPCVSRNNFDHRVDSHNTSPSPPDLVEETLKLSVIDLQTLTKQSKWKGVLENLSSLNISPTFDCKNAAIKLRGPCSVAALEQGKTLLLELITQLKPMTLRDESAHKPTAGFHQQVSAHPQPEIYALDPKEDADTLKLWNTRLLPRFPDMVRESLIEGSYSAALVRQNGPDGSQPVIRFRSSENQGKMSRQIIQESVETICIDNCHQILHVQFTEGTIVRLVGGTSYASFVNDPSNDDKFPHARRPWTRPGMGASIGLSHCPHVSATLGGYISVDERIYMLTVDHFISASPCNVDAQLRSPSISDAADVKDQLKKKFQQLGLKISRSAPNEIPLGQLDEMLFTSDFEDELEHYRRFERELDDGGDGFSLGKIRYRCGGVMAPPRPAANPLLPGHSYRMDWSLSDITARHREGKNVHRHGRVASPSLDDLEREVMRPEGCGIPCETVGEATGGEEAYYVGTTSGLREGKINPALTQYKDSYGISNERSLIVSRCETLRNSDFQGDSGSWIISTDNKLMGLLWGWDNGSLLFTPIQDVFADIKQKMNCRQIKLPEYPSSPRSEHSMALLCRTSFCTTQESTPELIEMEIVEPDEPTSSLLSPYDHVKSRRGSSASNTSNYSVYSLPSLRSSSSSISEGCSPGIVPPALGLFEEAGSGITLTFRAKPQPSLTDWVSINNDDFNDHESARPLEMMELDREDCKPALA